MRLAETCPPPSHTEARAALLPAGVCWGVARTRPRAEKALGEYLESRDVPYYLPLIEKRRVHGRHVRDSRLPLFPGYVFFGLDVIDRQQVFESRKVAQILEAPDPDRLRRELENLALGLRADGSLREARFQRLGMPVQVVRGPLKGLWGELVRSDAASHLIVQVTFIGRSAELKIDEAYVEPVS